MTDTPKNQETANAVAEQNFATILAKLKSIVERLEGGSLPLEDALKDFEQGINLSRKGQEILDAAERKVEILLKDGTTAPMPEAK